MVYRKNTGDDVALHITYSRGSRNIILNSFRGGAWEQEEHYNGSLIREQAVFEIRVAVQPDRFEVGYFRYFMKRFFATKSGHFADLCGQYQAGRFRAPPATASCPLRVRGWRYQFAGGGCWEQVG